ncbi:class I lanthipeptide [Flavobacterium cerinum]|uniref:Class I lanthipeptide n=1 Tax=Flavobacterium cerinum TaxID=2502784 RepID=A0ABY5ITN3_9FLAO|nr:class I lanthipeptide [Flavobacterium cerinum]UUC46201.1 class I lanthipeptide [Flavobacterium cerinum]
MKSQNANSKLAFAKNSVAELNPAEMMTVNGGSTIVGGETCSGCVCLPILTVVRDLAVLA